MNLTSILPVRASQRSGSAIGVGNDPSVCNFCNFPFKLFTETAESDSSSREFQRLITRSVKSVSFSSTVHVIYLQRNSHFFRHDIPVNAKPQHSGRGQCGATTPCHYLRTFSSDLSKFHRLLSSWLGGSGLRTPTTPPVYSSLLLSASCGIVGGKYVKVEE